MAQENDFKLIFKRPGWLDMPPVLYPKAYLSFVLLAALDVALTWCVLILGGIELNYLADVGILYWDKTGLLVYKFCLVTLVIICCEVIGRARYATGRRLARFSVVISCVPIVMAVVQLVMFERS